MKKNLFLLFLLLTNGTHPKSYQFASGSYDNTIKLWTLNYPDQIECKKTLSAAENGHKNKVRSITYSPDGKYLLSCSYDKTIKIWAINLPDGIECAKTFSAAKNKYSEPTLSSFSSIACNPNGKYFISGSDNKTIGIWDIHLLDKAKCIKAFSLEEKDPDNLFFSTIKTIAYNPNGKHLATGSFDKKIRILDINTPNKIKCINTLSEKENGHNGAVCSVAYSPDGTYLTSGSEDKTIKIWAINLPDKIECIKTLSKKNNGHNGCIWSVALSPDGKYLASGSSDNTIKIWSINLPDKIECIKTLSLKENGHKNWVYSVAFSPDNKYLISGSKDNTIKLWAIDLPDKIKSIKTLSFAENGHTDSVISVAFMPKNTDNNFMKQDLEERVQFIREKPDTKDKITTLKFPNNTKIKTPSILLPQKK